MPQLAKTLTQHHGFICTVLFPFNKAFGEIDPETLNNIPGLPSLRDPDLMVNFTRFRCLPEEQMKLFLEYVHSGKPILGIRTASPAFKYPLDSPYAEWSFRYEEKGKKGGCGRQVLGETGINHHGQHEKESTRGIIADGRENHSVVKGIKDIWGLSEVVGITTLSGDSKPQIMGYVLKGMKADDLPNPDKKIPAHCLDQELTWVQWKCVTRFYHHHGTKWRFYERGIPSSSCSRLLLVHADGERNPCQKCRRFDRYMQPISDWSRCT